MDFSLRGITSVTPISPGVFRAEGLGDRGRQGNAHPIAYGGLALSQAVSAGQVTIPKSTGSPPFHLYSVLGSYLGPASTQTHTTFTVTEIRTTRTFCTRQILASQTLPDPKNKTETTRNILVVLMDWHVQEPSSLLIYASPPIYPLAEYSTPDKLPSTSEMIHQNLSPKMEDAYRKMFPLMIQFFDCHPVTHSLGAQTALGMDYEKESTQDGLPVTERTNSYWWRTNEAMRSDAEQTAATAFYLDGALSFLPMTFSHLPLNAAVACSSLDFALRLFRPMSTSDWHLIEQHTEAAANARTFSVARVYDQSGREVATMSQSSILRPREGDGISSEEEGRAKARL